MIYIYIYIYVGGDSFGEHVLESRDGRGDSFWRARKRGFGGIVLGGGILGWSLREKSTDEAGKD